MGNKCYSSSKNGSSLAQTKFYIIPKHVSPFKKSKQDGFTLETETQPAVPLKFLIVIDKVKCKNLSQVKKIFCFFDKIIFFNVNEKL